jgi:predicted transglutaminase-like cysteine proteinase
VRLNAKPFLHRGLPPIAFAVALTLGGGNVQAETRTALPSLPRAAAVRNHPVMPVPGWIRFCKQRPGECAVNLSERATITLTPQVWETLTRINQQVNATIKPVIDLEHLGVEDQWDLAEDGYGNCEDYQLVKRKLLVAAGFSRRGLRMTSVIDGHG